MFRTIGEELVVWNASDPFTTKNQWSANNMNDGSVRFSKVNAADKCVNVGSRRVELSGTFSVDELYELPQLVKVARKHLAKE